MNIRPDFIRGTVIVREFDGITNDLLTGGLGVSGLEKRIPPDFTDPLRPTDLELRTRAIHFDYRGLMDMTEDGGFGLFFGPHAEPAPGKDGKIAGKEYIAFSDDGTGRQNVTLMVHIPASFDPDNAWIIAAPSSGSRGIFGAVGVVGEWALKRGFAVAYTDKGTGAGVHDLTANTITALTGERRDADACKDTGETAHFIAPDDPRDLKAYREAHPHRMAFKHAHSGINPEKDWGTFVLQSIQFAFYILNLPENYGAPDADAPPVLTRENTRVIASGISNGGGSSIRAAEQDETGLIDAVVVSEPNVTPRPQKDLVIRQGERMWKFPNHSRPLLDYHTLLNLYQPCANLTIPNRYAPFSLVDRNLCENRCRAMREKGLLQSQNIDDQARVAQEIINRSGILEEQNPLQPSHYTFGVTEGICVTYANAYGRFHVSDRLCGFSFSGMDDRLEPAAVLPETLADFSARSNGIPPTPASAFTEAQQETLAGFDPPVAPPFPPPSVIEIINDNSEGGPMMNRYSVSADGIRDMNLEGALRLRQLFTGTDASGNPLPTDEAGQHRRVREGIDEILLSGNLRGKPAVIVHGRSDAILPPNHTSRAYLGTHQLRQGASESLRYYEIVSAHHMDAFNALPGFNAMFVPLHYYLIQALDLMREHLLGKKEPPPSQVIRAVPRGFDEDGDVPPLTADHLPPISPEPSEGDRIVMVTKTLIIPE